MAQEKSFTAAVKIAGINPYVDVPPRVVETLGDGPKVAVLVKVAATGATKKKSTAVPQTGRLEKDAAQLKAIARLAPGGWFRSTIVPSRSSGPRLYLDTWMRDAAGVGVGDSVRVTLKPDHGSREMPMPEALREALEGNAQAQAAWDALTPSRQREILTYLNFLKTPAALERNVKKTIDGLVAKGGHG